MTFLTCTINNHLHKRSPKFYKMYTLYLCMDMYKYYMEVLQHLNKIQILVLSATIERVLQHPKDMLLPIKNCQALPFSIQPPYSLLLNPLAHSLTYKPTPQPSYFYASKKLQLTFSLSKIRCNSLVFIPIFGDLVGMKYHF